ncbi:MAG: substrate-binding domain-containing protein [Betaproteobacteria bacterium]|nr:substrate-binding domain-containing protein [Betaproteobacteria bacterium]
MSSAARTSLLIAVVAFAAAGDCASADAQKTPLAPDANTARSAAKFTAIPPNKDNDLKLYYADGRMLKGAAALEHTQQDAELILWLAGNQFFAMDDVVHAFQRANPGIDVGLITLPPGLLLAAIQNGGVRYGDKDYPGRPDVYASVNLGHLKKLAQAGLMKDFAIYMHNEMVLMVAQGNPLGIKGVADLKRPDVRSSMPNPVNEGIMQFYGRKVLERHGLWQHVSAGKECFSCQTTPNNWFTSVHHRETPDRILAGTSDTGFVWITEAFEAKRQNKAIEAVNLPPEDSLRDEVAYAIGAVSGPHATAANRYLAFLATPAAQTAYAKYGFVNATPDELRLRPIP